MTAYEICVQRDFQRLADAIQRLKATHKSEFVIRSDYGEIVVSDYTTEGRGCTLDDAIADFEQKVAA